MPPVDRSVCLPGDDRPVVGIDLGATHMQVGVVDASHRIVGQARAMTLADEGPDAVIARLANAVRAACADAGVRLADLAGVGVGAASPIDATNRIVLNAVNLRWRRVPLADLLTQRLDGVPVTLDNDVNVAVWGEYRLGAAAGYRDVLGVWVGTGIGGGLVLDGRLHAGAFGTAGEIGHVIILPSAGRAAENLEQHGSRTAIVENACKLLRSNRVSCLSEMAGVDPDAIGIAEIARAVAAGDELAAAVAGHSADWVGLCAANVATLLSLDCVVLGGGAAEALGDWYMQRVRAAFDRYVFPDELRACAIVPTRLRENAGLLGAALLARERCGGSTMNAPSAGPARRAAGMDA